MNADINAFVDKIIADAEKKVRTDLVNASSMIKRDFTKVATEVVLLYYAHYTKPPRLYERTNNLRDNVVDDTLSFNVLNGDEYGAYVQFNSDKMQDYRVGNKDEVVSNFMYGIHGKPSIFMESLPAIELMENFQDNYKKTLDTYFLKLGYIVK